LACYLLLGLSAKCFSWLCSGFSLQILTAKAAAGFSLQSGSLGSANKDSAVPIKKRVSSKS